MRHLLPPSLLALATALAVVLGGCGSGSSTTTETVPVACRRVPAPEPRGEPRRRKSTALLSAQVRWTATVVTNCGTFEITLDARDSPRTTGSFATLARAGFYNGLDFHRIARDFVIQGGDPLGNGIGGPGYTIAEAPPRGTRYLHGTVAMAKTATDPDGTSGSQFFIVTGEDAKLPPQYALLGQVTAGIDVVDAINDQPLETGDPQGSAPVSPIVIERITISRS
ncbi:peptidylprolyl isomerase [Conexibacter sp. CPCC 206217]|uniref:peptidylprolyl isomerase n=1 Tax=Conexibacter sp. CPCC 206217 TaxID=3064574 RepID=UPI0027193D99|nr:peptidylprolyl isomerase [Conexibacter sp. CPCC 206217]MDO8210560.1 peptidylprolyl isomerase [Conexibacter sp. CPCC 206217]